MLDGFERRRVATDGADIHLATGGDGPPLLLLHGYPQNHLIWHAVAPRLAERFTLVMPDLRGYGESTGPAPDAENVLYSKRTMAADMVAVMRALGHDRFGLAGHDRGGRVAYRLTLDHPNRVTRLAALDIVPTFEVWTEMNWKGALGGFHWPFLAQPAPLPERMIGADPDPFIGHLIERWAGDPGKLEPEATAAYLKQFHKPEVIAATCADYRAGATTDMDHDRADREAGKKIGCPVLLVWGRRYLTAKAGSPLDSWRQWADDVREAPLDCGHFVAEEEPDACAAALIGFFGDD